MKVYFLLSFFLLFSVFLSRFNFHFLISWKPVHFFVAFCILFLVHLRVIKVDKNVKILFSSFSVFYIYFCLTAVWGDDLLESIKMILGMSFVLIAIWVSSAIFSRLDSNEFRQIFSRVGAAVSLLTLLFYFLGLVQYHNGQIAEKEIVWGVLVEKGVPRLVGIHSDPNFMALFALVFLFYFLNHSSTSSRLLFLVYFLIAVLTLSRSGLMAMGVGFMVYILCTNRKAIKFALLSFMSLFVCLVLWLKDAEVLKPIIKARLSGLESGAGRFELWENGIQLFLDNPLFGVGLFQFRSEMLERFGSTMFAHNTYLGILVESGVIGLFLFLFFLSVVFFLLFIRRENGWALPTFASMLVMLLSLSLTAQPFLYIIVVFVSAFALSEKNRESVEVGCRLN